MLIRVYRQYCGHWCHHRWSIPVRCLSAEEWETDYRCACDEEDKLREGTVVGNGGSGGNGVGLAEEMEWKQD